MQFGTPVEALHRVGSGRENTMNETRRGFMKLVGGAVVAAGTVMVDSRDAQAESQPPRTECESREFRPGEKVPISAVYDVIHDRIDGQPHAADHQLTLAAGRRFPNCKVCQGWVKFRVHQG